MAIWNCASCGEDNDSDFGICWNCGVQLDGAARAKAHGDPSHRPMSIGVPIDLPFDDDTPEERELKCLRCGAAMHALGRMHLHPRGQGSPLAYDRVGELLVNRDAFDAYACSSPSCGRLELFAVTLEEVSLGG